jgi:hypothetical protein
MKDLKTIAAAAAVALGVTAPSAAMADGPAGSPESQANSTSGPGTAEATTTASGTSASATADGVSASATGVNPPTGRTLGGGSNGGTSVNNNTTLRSGRRPIYVLRGRPPASSPRHASVPSVPSTTVAPAYSAVPVAVPNGGRVVPAPGGAVVPVPTSAPIVPAPTPLGTARPTQRSPVLIPPKSKRLSRPVLVAAGTRTSFQLSDSPLLALVAAGIAALALATIVRWRVRAKR